MIVVFFLNERFLVVKVYLWILKVGGVELLVICFIKFWEVSILFMLIKCYKIKDNFFRLLKVF